MPSHGDDEEMIATSPEKPIKVVLETEPPARKPGRPRLDISAHFQDTGEMANHSHRFVWCIGCIKSGRPLFKRDRLPARGDLMQRHLQNCRYVSDEVRQKFKGSPRSSSASSAGDSKARKARIANIISEPGPLHSSAGGMGSSSGGNNGNSGAAGPLTSAGPRLPPITTISSNVERSKLTTVISRPASSTSTSAPVATSTLASSEQQPAPMSANMTMPVPLSLPISMPLRPPYSLSRPSSGGNDNQLPRIRSPMMRSSTPVDLPSISRRSHPYLNRDRHPSSASLRGSQTPKTPVASPPSPQNNQGQGTSQHHHHHQHQHYHHQQSTQHPLYSASPIQHHIDHHSQRKRGPRSSPSSAGSSIGMSELPAPVSAARVSPLSLSSSSHPGARRSDIAASEFQTPLPSTAIVTPVNSLRGKLQSGSPAFGIVLNIPSPVTARLASRLGYDWACIDMEHSAHSANTMAEMVAAINSSGTCTPVVRVPSHSSEWIRWAVDAGAQGIIVPGVHSREQMQHLVSVCRNATAFAQKYPRHNSPESHAYQQHNRHHYQSMQPQPQPAYHAEPTSNSSSSICADVVIIPQIDRPEAVSDIDGILSVPGVDAAFVRPQALAAELAPILPPLRTIEPHRSLGIVGGSEEPVSRVLRSSHRHSVPLGIDSVDGSSSGIRARVHQGFQLVTVASDIDALASAAADQLRMARAV
ncbi:hypothetical protein IWW45_001854 [Coemansia sp. RSA 485]|nr:hypothetical protein IWW45_001854 [Coemansia sp. RSA 485]